MEAVNGTGGLVPCQYGYDSVAVFIDLTFDQRLCGFAPQYSYKSVNAHVLKRLSLEVQRTKRRSQVIQLAFHPVVQAILCASEVVSEAFGCKS